MKYRTLGPTDITVSTICMGCWGLASDFHWGPQDDAASIATVHAALDAGVNFFDTAELYGAGRSDEVLGRALAGRRDQAVIASKVSSQYLEPADLVESFENSLRRLRTDYLDLFQIHWPNWDIPLEETWAALEQLQTQGKIRAIGVSNFGVIDLPDLLEIGRTVSDQLPYSLLFRAIEYGVQEICVEEDIGILCYSPLLHGLLSGHHSTLDQMSPPALALATSRQPGPTSATTNRAARPRSRRRCKKFNASAPTSASLWRMSPSPGSCTSPASHRSSPACASLSKPPTSPMRPRWSYWQKCYANSMKPRPSSNKNLALIWICGRLNLALANGVASAAIRNSKSEIRIPPPRSSP